MLLKAATVRHKDYVHWDLLHDEAATVLSGPICLVGYWTKDRVEGSGQQLLQTGVGNCVSPRQFCGQLTYYRLRFLVPDRPANRPRDGKYQRFSFLQLAEWVIVVIKESIPATRGVSYEDTAHA